MFVTEMSGPADADDGVTKDLTWDGIEEAIHRLDGQKHTLVVLSNGQDTPQIGIGGGGGRYVCYVTFDNESFYNLVNSDGSNGLVMLVAGGQLGDHSAKQCVDLASVLKAAKTFVEQGLLESSVSWAENVSLTD